MPARADETSRTRLREKKGSEWRPDEIEDVAVEGRLNSELLNIARGQCHILVLLLWNAWVQWVACCDDHDCDIIKSPQHWTYADMVDGGQSV